MALLFASSIHDPVRWERELKRHLPDLDFRLWPDVGDPQEIEFTLIQSQAKIDFGAFPNLKAVFTFGAGVDHVLRQASLPEHVPIGRGVSLGLVQHMTQYVVYWVVHYHRDLGAYRDAEEDARWQHPPWPDTSARRVGILGPGALGADAARKLVDLGFPVAAWSRTPKDIEGVESFHGDAQLLPFLNRTDIAVCLLPLTAATRGIINADTLAALPKGAFVINAARGGHVVDDDLVAALDFGHIAGATLDVFHTEPLPAEHPFWRHSKVRVTPHAASRNVVELAAAHHAENMRRVLAGQPPRPLVDRAVGY